MDYIGKRVRVSGDRSEIINLRSYFGSCGLKEERGQWVGVLAAKPGQEYTLKLLLEAVGAGRIKLTPIEEPAWLPGREIEVASGVAWGGGNYSYAYAIEVDRRGTGGSEQVCVQTGKGKQPIWFPVSETRPLQR